MFSSCSVRNLVLNLNAQKDQTLEIRNSQLLSFYSTEKSYWQENFLELGFLCFCVLSYLTKEHSRPEGVADIQPGQPDSYPTWEQQSSPTAGDLPLQAQGLMATGNWCWYTLSASDIYCPQFIAWIWVFCQKIWHSLLDLTFSATQNSFSALWHLLQKSDIDCNPPNQTFNNSDSWFMFQFLFWTLIVSVTQKCVPPNQISQKISSPNTSTKRTNPKSFPKKFWNPPPPEIWGTISEIFG